MNPLKAVIAIDSFKGSLSSLQAGEAVKQGIYRVFPNAQVEIRPVADGGEGTVQALVTGLNGHLAEAEVCDPLGRKITAQYGILPNRTAVIEMAAASGLPLLSDSERNPMLTTTYGTGELILHAIKNGCRSFIIGIGGSATNDGGIGCLQALGFEMLDRYGKQVSYGAAGLKELVKIRRSNIVPELKECRFHVACDVANPLCGENGCSTVFAPQKGADRDMITVMDELLRNYAELTKQYNPSASQETAGTGAAGGLGFALMYYLNAELKSGISQIIQETGLEEAICSADLVITGEGCLDAQTSMGKAPVGIAKIAKKHNKPVIAFCGTSRPGAELCNQNGIDAFFPVIRSICTLDEAMEPSNAFRSLSETAEQVFRTIRTFRAGAFYAENTL